MQKISRLQFIHSHNVVHRDLKPSNIVMGLGKHANVIYIIDFGLSKEFWDPCTCRHIPYGNTHSLIGSATFASVHSHLGMEHGRRDDLESLAYILIYFLRGSLPWQGLDINGHDLVAESKQQTSTHDLCEGLPPEVHAFLDYSRSLSFYDKPDYNYLHGLFDNPSSQVGLQSDTAFDWDKSDGAQFRTMQELYFNGVKYTDSSEHEE